MVGAGSGFNSQNWGGAAKNSRPYYDRDYAEFNLNADRIAEEGRYLLYRALNIGRSIAFVGTGVSIARGRPSWSALIERMKDLLQAPQGSSARVIDEFGKLEHLYEALKGTSRSYAFSDPDLFSLQAHILRMGARWRAAIRARATNATEDDGRSEFDKEFRRKLWTEDVRAEMQEKFGELRQLTHNPKRNFECFNTIGTLKAAAGGFAEHFPNIFKRPENQGLNREQMDLLPSLLLRHLFWTGGKKITAFGVDWKDQHPEEPLLHDPIQDLYVQLDVRRVLTTNYDFELERGLGNLGFLKHDLGGASRKAQPDGHFEARSSKGLRARASVLQSETAADLIEFASFLSDFHYEIFHLHGRAGLDDPLVVTERDYQKLYLRMTPERHMMSESLRVAFAGNPIVFIGLGMQEPDVLRPLRRFMSDPEAQNNRSIIAILPAEQDGTMRSRVALDLYLRYGVHAIFFGGGYPGEDKPSPNSTAAPWTNAGAIAPAEPSLYLCLQRLEAIEAALREGPDAQAADFRSWLTGAAAFCEKPSKKCPYPETEIDSAAVDYVLGTPFRNIAVEAGWFGEGGRAGKSRSKRTSLEVLSEIGLAASIFTTTIVAWAQAKNPGKTKYIQDLLRITVRGLNRHVRTACLCRALTAAAKEREAWWLRWRELPRARDLSLDPQWYVAGKWESCDRKDWHRPKRPIRIGRYGLVDGVHTASKLTSCSWAERVSAHLERKGGGAKTNAGRRVVLALGPKGCGKGRLFHDLHQSLLREKGRWTHGQFANAAFSTEYSSVTEGAALVAQLMVSNHENQTPLISRAASLEAALKSLQSGKKINGRLLLVFAGIDLLFRPDGTPKNRDIADNLAVMLGKKLENAPLDIVLICGSRQAGHIFLGGGDDCLKPIGEAPSIAKGPFEICSIGRVKHPPQEECARNPEDVGGHDIAKLRWRRYRDLDSKAKAFVIPSPNTESDEELDGFFDDNAAFVEPDPARRKMRELVAGRVFFNKQPFGPFYRLGGRYIRTVLGAVARSLVTPTTLAPAEEFFTNIRDSRLPGNRDRREEALLEIALKRRELNAKTPKEKAYSRLEETILKHLAVISMPVELGVLAECPEVRRILAQEICVDKQTDALSFSERVGLIVPALENLERDCLLFRLEARKDAEDDAACVRFGVHPLVQSYFFRRIGSSHLEFGDSRLFAVSVWGSQPAELPAPSKDAYEFLDGLLRELIEYPNAVRVLAGTASASPAIQVCKLRAGLGLVRAAFSLAVVARFADFGEPAPRVERVYGHFESYRMKLRWMIYAAGELGTQKEFNRILPLYQEEITWLYNECALVSLMQGNLHDAIALMDCAIASNRKAEGTRRDGPNAIRLRLNRCAIEIERGAIDATSGELDAIVAESTDELPVYAIAQGFRGLVAHLRGQALLAQNRYEQAVTILNGLGKQGRALAIFHRHWSDLYRSLHDWPRAHEHLRAAKAGADTSRQQDQIHWCEVSQARLEMLSRIHCGPATGDLQPAFASAHALLDRAQKYADLMEMHGLNCEILAARASLSLVQGETRSAGDFAVSSMALASLHGMRLRVASGMLRMGTILRRRGYDPQGRRLLESARAACERLGYQTAAEQASRALIEAFATFE